MGEHPSRAARILLSCPSIRFGILMHLPENARAPRSTADVTPVRFRLPWAGMACVDLRWPFVVLVMTACCEVTGS